MGLPVWKTPDEERYKNETFKTDPTAAARSPIRRRRASVHGRPRSTRLPREPTLTPSRYERTPPPASAYSGLRSNNRGVPPVSTLLESADRRSAAPPPPPRIEPPNDYGVPVSPVSNDRNRYLRNTTADVNGEATRRTVYSRSREEIARRRTRAEDRWRTSPPPRWTGSDGHLSAPRSRFLTRENTPFHRSPEPMAATDRPDSRNGNDTGRSNLPTPPLEQSEEPDSLFMPEQLDSRRPRAMRSAHPLSNSWRPESPINGLGDRNRSPTPADGWEIMQTTITPDIALPSADSSFTSAAASQSFGSNETSITEPDREPDIPSRREFSSRSDSESDNGSLDEVDADEREATAHYAREMYYFERGTEEGISRIFRHRRAFDAEGNRFALANESEQIEIGFRLIDEALNSEEGRRRVFEISQHRPQEARSFEDWIFSRRDGSRRRRPQSSDDEEPPCPQPENRTTSEDAAREANAQVHDYFRRFTADSLVDTHRTSTIARRWSPPPRYEPSVSPPLIETFISRDPPEPHPVSPPSARSQNEVGDLLLSGDEQDLNAVRRVVERLAQRDDVPDEWWMSMGLNLSRTRVRSRSRSPAGSRRIDAPSRSPRSAITDTRVRAGRIERSGASAGSRL